MILALLEKGADAAKRTTKGEQPLHCAAEKGHVDAIGVLLDAPGSDVNAPQLARSSVCSAAHPPSSGSDVSALQPARPSACSAAPEK